MTLTDGDREDIRMRTLLAVGLVTTASPERLRAVVEHIITGGVERGKIAGRAEAIAEAARVCDEHAASLERIAMGPLCTDAGRDAHISASSAAENCAAAVRALADA